MKIKNYFLSLTVLVSSFAFGQTGTTISGSMTSGGKTRTYTVYVPLTYTALNVSVPLVINIHGLTGTSATQATAQDFRKISDTANFIIVHPQGLSAPIAPGIPLSQTGWGVLGTVAAWEEDKNFIIELLEKLATQYSINRNKIYSTGFSQGGFMSYDFACFVQGRFAAIASVSGSLASAHYSACAPVHPVPVMEIHGTNDGVIDYAGAGITPTIHVDTMVKYWVKHNQCNLTPALVDTLVDAVDSAAVDLSKVVHYVYTGGTSGATVELFKVLNGGHQVPSAPPVPTGYGTGTTNQDFTASKEIWRFFSKYSLSSLGVTPITSGTVSPIGTGIADNQNDADIISVYPNPSNGAFSLYVENTESSSLQVVNILGNIVFESKITEPHTKFDLTSFSKGIYFYKVIHKGGTVKSGKLIFD